MPRIRTAWAPPHGYRTGALRGGTEVTSSTYHGNLVIATADDVAIAVLVPAPAHNAIKAEVGTLEVPDLLPTAVRP